MAQQQAIVQGIHQALVDSIGMPQDELFNLVASARTEVALAALPSR